MAKQEYDEIKAQLSPGNKVKWATNKFYERWIKINQRNAPDKKKNPGQTKVGVEVDQSDARGAELSVDVVEIMEKYGLKIFDVCEDGEPTQYEIPARQSTSL